MRKLLSLLKLRIGCICGFNAHAAALHFHHIDPCGKYEKLSKMASHSFSRVLAELRKCHVVCANCHAIHHYEETS
jgi:hypothetical protein